jgi:1-acyl-sn-glycerol-3-phosphate acyltransferase
MVAKRELFKIPVFGWGLYLTGFIPIDRGDRKSAQKSLNMISQKLSKNYQIWMAPEGTRSSDGQLLPFKSGAFRSAIEWKVPILPCVIFNTGDIQPKGTTQIKTSSIVYVRVLPEISTQNYSIKEYSKLRDEVYQAMKSTLAQS